MPVVKYAFAVTREQFKDRVWEFVLGGMGEFFKLHVATANDYPTYVIYWDSEVGRLIDNILNSYVEEAETKTPFDKRVAAEESIARVKQITRKKWNYAYNAIAKQLKVRVTDLKKPDEMDVEAAYWLRVQQAIADGLSGNLP
jgi:hypothetical protein